MHNEFIRLLKAKYKEFQTLELEEWYCEEQTYNEYDKLDIMGLLNILRIREKQITIMKYWFGYSDIEGGGKLNITRQTVNRINKRSLDKMHKYLSLQDFYIFIQIQLIKLNKHQSVLYSQLRKYLIKG